MRPYGRKKKEAPDFPETSYLKFRFVFLVSVKDTPPCLLYTSHLERYGHDERIDHRSNAARGLDEQPTIHEGVNARALERKGMIADRCEDVYKRQDMEHGKPTESRG